ncbi:MAG: hypothetical protein PHW00_05125 [Clostridia bacterium]|nr:hypothetical protein [Clostridia bacterium]
MLRQTLIIKQIDNRFSKDRNSITGIAKLTCENTTTNVELKLYNVNTRINAQWILALQCGNAHYLPMDSLTTFTHTIVENKIDRVSLIVLAKQDKLYPVAHASTHLVDYDNRLLTLAQAQDYGDHQSSYSQYEKFIVATDNYYTFNPDLISQYRSALDIFYQNGTTGYFVQVKKHLIELFDSFPAYPPLIQLIDNSYWIRIQRKDAFFCLGILTDRGVPTHICYALPLRHALSPNLHDYHIIYQSAIDGKLTTDYQPITQ